MRVSLKWLREYVDLVLPVPELARRLTLSTAEVEAIEPVGGAWENVFVGRVLRVAPHPNADRLRLATVDAGAGARTVVCGAPNLAEGQKIAFAQVGAQLIDGHTGKPAVLKANVIRGVESAGMVCSERELGLSDDHDGILVLPEEAPVGTPLREYLGDTVLDLYSWPHRPDLMSMVGVAREVAALSGQALREPSLEYHAEGGPIDGRVRVDIADPDLCPRYIGALVDDVQPGPSPAWMQERLTAAGMRPINNIVDVTNYVMLETGQPLHAFDYDRVVDHRIIVRRARDGERLRTLDGEERVLDGRMLVIADPSGPIALAGVMGGAHSEVGPQTKRILLEAANFNGINIRSTSMRLRLRSEASARFEKSIGPEVALVGALRAVKLLVESCGGRAAEGTVDAYPERRPAPVVDLAPERIRAVLGFDAGPEQVRGSLEALGFAVADGPPRPYRVQVPYWRTDVHIPDDVVEEFIRIAGYETVPAQALSGPVPEVVPEPLYELRNRVQDLLVACGMQEVITYSLVGGLTAEAQPQVADGGLAPLRIVNPASLDHAVLRESLRPSLLHVLAGNLRQRRGRLALFETARVYLPRADDLPDEREVAAGVIAGRRLDRWGMPAAEGIDFFDAKGIVETVLDRLGVAAQFRAAAPDGLVAGRSAEIVSGDRTLGILGQISPSVTAPFDIADDVYCFELSLNAMLPLLQTSRSYRAYSRYPAVDRDLALLVADSVEAAALETIIRQGRFVVDVHPFDVYSGHPIPAGHKSIAFAVRYQAADHTLTDDEVARSRGRTVQRLERELGAHLREA